MGIEQGREQYGATPEHQPRSREIWDGLSYEEQKHLFKLLVDGKGNDKQMEIVPLKDDRTQADEKVYSDALEELGHLSPDQRSKQEEGRREDLPVWPEADEHNEPQESESPH